MNGLPAIHPAECERGMDKEEIRYIYRGNVLNPNKKSKLIHLFFFE